MEFIVVTGLSGAGKSKALNAFEDIGFYCVDNIPPELISSFYNLCEEPKNSKKRVAVVVDTRSSEFNVLKKYLERLKLEKKEYKVLYLDAKEEVLKIRYKETRRKHPLYEVYSGSISKAIELEQNLLRVVKEVSDYIIDTSHISPAQLKEKISSIFLKDVSSALTVICESFGFKYGMPTEADLVLDVRCLPNPYYVDDLKDLTGLSDEVKSYVINNKVSQGFIKLALPLIDYMLPLYQNEGKSQLLIAIGCTGGKHRSVALAQHFYEHLLLLKYNVNVTHRDIDKQ